MVHQIQDTVTIALMSILLFGSILIADCAPISYVYLYAKEDAQYIHSDEYRGNRDVMWVITNYGYQSVVVAEVEDLEIRVTSGCTTDYLQFYDGRFQDSLSLGRYCGTEEPSVKSTGGTLIIRIKTNGAAAEFKIKYYVDRDPYERFLKFFGITLGIIISLFSLYIIYNLCCAKKKSCRCCSRRQTSVQRIHIENNRRGRRRSVDSDTEIWTATIAMRRLTSRDISDRTVTHPPPAMPTQPPPYTSHDFTLAGYTSAVEINPDEPPTSPPPEYTPQMDLVDCTNQPGYVNNRD